MNKIILSIFFILGCSALSSNIKAQELNLKITVNSSALSGVNKDVFTSLEQALSQFINGRKWTDATFAQNEQIEGAMLITLEEMPDQNTYKGNIQVTSTRPVYNSSYNTPIFNFKDNEVEFSYLQGENLQFSDNNINNNLTAIMAFYAYIILGLDFDSFALSEGKPYFDKALNIANSGQSLNTSGWAVFGSDKNRYALAVALSEESSADFHTMWYNYHRKGLDDMAANAARGRAVIEATVPELEAIKKARPSSPILSFYGDTKLEELINIYTEATTEEKKNAYKTLESIFPTKRYIFQKIKQ